ncbi:MAG: phage holin family protein [Actinobacteria bacterium]|nr:MAG: phage holin family protein [Actinomycetota bacterium]
MKWLARLLINAAVIFILAMVTDGSLINVSGFGGALLAALVLGLVNAFIRPVVLLISLPLNLVTLGLFTFVVNALMLMLVSAILEPIFEVAGFWQALVASLMISLVSSVLSKQLREDRRR